ncbi:MAG: RHS repeat protein [Planctomycetaceae bacterium]|nr:RHS repeat protein [Planctomycetaceae bacterium]
MFTSDYDDDGRLTKLTNPEGEVTSFSFDAAGNLALVVNLNSASTTLTSFAYGFDGVGDRTGVVEANGNYANWKYDGTNQHGADHYYSAWSWNTLTLPQWEIATADDWHLLSVDALATYSNRQGCRVTSPHYLRCVEAASRQIIKTFILSRVQQHCKV